MTVRRRRWRDAAGVQREAWSVDVQVIGKDGLIRRARRTPQIQTRRAAEKLERELRAELLAEEEDEAKVESPRFAEFADKFLSTYASVNNRPSEVGSKESILRVHLVPAFGKMGLDEIGPKQIEGYKARKLDKGLSRKTINNHLTVLRKLLVVATEWKALEHVPPIQWLKPPPPEFDFLTFEEVPKFIDATEPEWRTMVTTALKTGLRLGELRALRWSDVDLGSGRLMVRRSITRGVITAPKNGRMREVPLSDQARAALQAHPRCGELVFCNPDGSILSKDQVKRVTYRACVRAGLRRLGWHCCRHTFASHLVMRGVPIRTVQELLGHQSIEMTMRYSHLSPDARRDAVQLLDVKEAVTLVWRTSRGTVLSLPLGGTPASPRRPTIATSWRKTSGTQVCTARVGGGPVSERAKAREFGEGPARAGRAGVPVLTIAQVALAA